MPVGTITHHPLQSLHWDSWNFKQIYYLKPNEQCEMPTSFHSRLKFEHLATAHTNTSLNEHIFSHPWNDCPPTLICASVLCVWIECDCCWIQSHVPDQSLPFFPTLLFLKTLTVSVCSLAPHLSFPPLLLPVCLHSPDKTTMTFMQTHYCVFIDQVGGE